jgi:AraC family transcriptional regulator
VEKIMMASNPDYLSSRLAHLTSASSVIDSSDSNSWDGILVEHHRIPEGERAETVTDQHVLWLWTTSFSGEYAGPRGRFVRSSKGPGALTVTPVGPVPTLHFYTRSEVILCALDSPFLGSVLSELDRQPSVQPIIRPNFQDSAIRRLMTLLLEERRAGAPSGKLYADSLAHALAIRYLQLGDRVRYQGLHSAASTLPRHALKRVIERIEHSFHSDVSLASLAEEAGYSRSHFLKMFRTSTGMTPHQYVLKRRIDHARSLLKRREMSIIDVAAYCGFSSQAHLTQVFRQHVGVTPAGYRRNQ